MAAALAGSEAPGFFGFAHLDHGVALHVFSFLKPRQLAIASTTCKLFSDLAKAPSLWQDLYQQEIPQSIQDVLAKDPEVPNPAPSSSSPSTGTDWRRKVIQGLALRDLRAAHWEPITPTLPTEPPAKPMGRMRPTAREGHAACSWGADSTSLLLFGGWGGGIHNDLYVLERTGEGKEMQWRPMRPRGDPPEIRYGHTLTRCGRNGEMAVVFGGMQSGGYMGEIEELAALRPVQGEATSSAPQAAPQLNTQTNTNTSAYEWYHPRLKGDKPRARGYHAACASQDGTKVYIFGGIAEHDCCNTLAIIDVYTWECELVTALGEAPLARFGCSLAEYKGGLWVIGGGHGHDLARSGYDLEDVHRLDLATRVWFAPAISNRPANPLALGRCHAYTTLGSKLIMYGGSLELSQDITWFDMEKRVWGRPTISGPAPASRMSAVMAVCGSDVILFGGWIYARGEMGDLHRLKLVLADTELQSIRTTVKGLSSSADANTSEDTTRKPWPVCPRADLRNARNHSNSNTSDVSTGSGSGAGPSGCNMATGPSCPAGPSRRSARSSKKTQQSQEPDTVPVETDTRHPAYWERGSVPTDDEEDTGTGGLGPGGLLPSPTDTSAPGPSGSRGGHGNGSGNGRNSTTGGGGGGSVVSEMAKYFGLLRQAQSLSEGGEDVPLSLVKAMQESMFRARVMRAAEANAMAAFWVFGNESHSEEDEDDYEYENESDEEEEKSDESDDEGEECETSDEGNEDGNESEGESEGKEGHM